MELLEGERLPCMSHVLPKLFVTHRTGTVKVGNHILAINGENLSGKTLLQIEDMLNNCGNSVTLKIRKNVKSSE